ncbi:hypothetical protein GCM10007962_07520 [Yeosuana aromativorans]|uniref:MotA/TolQ/ExbB proton channel domain-containing protein n=1 Tax=Yeosuana aromativorans TaxID=288019 RepID=A0A8J3BJP8_9FLAO|nr:MotA/TolQ/ExbB proton channel family protein [Yeosuana aromativorans]GGK15748.1 hypothetical protein GCM10007962_07520 [Yeosuana aromativorans]
MIAIVILQNPGFFSELSKRFNEGGPFFMTLILITLLLSLGFLTKGFLRLKDNPEALKKMLRLVGDTSLLGLVLGFLGSMIGLIGAFDAIESFDKISTAMIAGGLKVSFLTTVFGSLVFIISRIGMLILRSMVKEQNTQEK